MEFGIALPTAAESWKLVQRAEALGFTHAWFYDTQMLCADCFVAMAAAAVNTSRIRLGTGVLIPSNRIAPVAANGFASLNALAPGRIDFGVGTGFTGRRAMGLGAMKLADMEEYVRVVLALLDEETAELVIEGHRQRVRFLNPELGLINTRDPVRLHVSAYGPKSRALTARLGAGWLNFIGGANSGIAELRDMQAAWETAGQDMADLSATAFALGCVLEPGEACELTPRPGAGGPACRRAVASCRRCCAGRTAEHVESAGGGRTGSRRVRGAGAALRAGRCAVSAEPSRTPAVREA